MYKAIEVEGKGQQSKHHEPIPVEFLKQRPTFSGMSSVQDWWKNLSWTIHETRLHVTFEAA